MKIKLLISFFVFVNTLFSFSQEVVFVQKDSVLAQYGFSNVHKSISGISYGLSYNKYVGKKGRIVGEKSNGFSNYYEIKLENGEIVFSTYNSDKYDIRNGKYHSMNDLYFVEDYNMSSA